MKKIIGLALGAAVVASVIVHRKAIAACIKGEPMPEPPAWHKHCSKGKKED